MRGSDPGWGISVSRTEELQRAPSSWYTTGTVATSAPSKVLPSAAWRSIIGTYDGSTVRLYVDGVLAATGASSIGGSISGSTAPLRVGVSAASGFNTLHGSVDDIVIRRDALNQAQITDWLSGY